jgi:hypothetical protein
VATLDIGEAVALLEPVEHLAPGGLHAFPMPNGLLEALQRGAAPDVAVTKELDAHDLPVLLPETVIAALRDVGREPEYFDRA